MIPVGSARAEQVIEAAVHVGVLRTNKYGQDEDGFFNDDGWDDDAGSYGAVETYEVIGQLMSLINDLKTAHDAAPYFISFYYDEASSHARDLHADLTAAGILGFMSDGLQTGSQFRVEIIRKLREARTVFILETPGYHTRPRCKVERDFAVAHGCRIVRVGTCDRQNLNGVPDWFNDIQHENFVSGGVFDIQQHLFGVDLPTAATLDLRRRAAMSLIEPLTGPKLDELAVKIGLENQLHGADLSKKSQLCAGSFASETQGNRFCAEYDLLAQF